MAVITKGMARNWLADVPEDKRFWCTDGKVMKNLFELEAALKGMSDDTFGYHSNQSKSDFHNWVKDVIGDEKLARDLLGSSSRLQALKKVGARVTQLRNKLTAG